MALKEWHHLIAPFGVRFFLRGEDGNSSKNFLIDVKKRDSMP
jgi:hypothetical protein